MREHARLLFDSSVSNRAFAFKRNAPHLPFEQTAVRELGKNAIVIRVQPDEGVTMRTASSVRSIPNMRSSNEESTHSMFADFLGKAGHDLR